MAKHPKLPREDNMFMCISKEAFHDICELFPQTRNNLIRKSLERRKRFMKAKNLNSKAYWKKRGLPPYETNPTYMKEDLD